MYTLTKDYIVTTLQEERLWKAGESDSFTYGNWDLTLRKEESQYEPFVYSVAGISSNGSSISRRYTSMEKAFLHIVNNFNENESIKNNYERIENYLLSR